MIIYNVTTIMEESIHQEYLEYMHKIHMPEVMSTGKFVDCKLYRLTEPENEGVTYCSQYFAENIQNINEYRAKYSPKLQEDFKSKFENNFVSFRSILELAETPE